ncbi:MAG: adenylate kinase [Sulfolobales archaeon]
MRHDFLVTVVVGVPGVGKSTVVSEALKILSSSNYNVLILNYGDFIFQELRESGLISSRDDLRRLPLRIQLMHQTSAAKRIIEYAKNYFSLKDIERSVLIVDTHLWIKTRAGYWPGLPHHVSQVLMPDLIAIIEADPEEIILRQSRDPTRYRGDYADPKLIEELQELNRREALVVATLTGAAIKIIKNREGEADKAAKELVDAIISLMPRGIK